MAAVGRPDAVLLRMVVCHCHVTSAYTAVEAGVVIYHGFL